MWVNKLQDFKEKLYFENFSITYELILGFLQKLNCNRASTHFKMFMIPTGQRLGNQLFTISQRF